MPHSSEECAVLQAAQARRLGSKRNSILSRLGQGKFQSTRAPPRLQYKSVKLHSTAGLVQAAQAKRLGSKRNSILSRLGQGEFQSSTKIEALRETVADMLAADPSAKAIVFSQFTSMLDLIAFRLDQVGCPLGILFFCACWSVAVHACRLASAVYSWMAA